MRIKIGLVLAIATLLGACEKPPSLIVGSKQNLEQHVVGEIVAQHLENRWNGEVQRRLNFGDTPILHQALLAGDVTLYPEYSGTIVSEILHEVPGNDPNVVFQRAKTEMQRTVQFVLMDPLGFDNRTMIAIRAADGDGIDTLSQAAARKAGWKIGVSKEFEHSAAGLPRLTSYGLPQSAPIFGMDVDQLFQDLNDGKLTMIAASAADGRLLSPGLKLLQDDQGVFLSRQAGLLVREDAFEKHPELRQILAELSGKITLDSIREMTRQVAVDERTPADVAREFLMQSGLKK